MRFLSALKQDFLVGLVAILPISVTIWVAVSVFHFVDRVMAPQIEALLGVRVPGMGVIASLVLVTLSGFLTRFVVVRRLGARIERGLETVPLLRTIYTAVKQVILPLAGGGEHRAFKQVVTFEWPGEGLWVVGFLVKERVDGDRPGPDDEVLVFLPTNHLHLGFVIATTRRRVHPVAMSIEDALRTQFSLGVAAPDIPLTRPPAG